MTDKLNEEMDWTATVERLVKLGLMPVNQLPYLKRAIQHMKKDMFMPIRERQVFYDFVQKVMDVSLGNPAILRLVMNRTGALRREDLDHIEIALQDLEEKKDITKTPKQKVVTKGDRDPMSDANIDGNARTEQTLMDRVLARLALDEKKKFPFEKKDKDEKKDEKGKKDKDEDKDEDEKDDDKDEKKETKEEVVVEGNAENKAKKNEVIRKDGREYVKGVHVRNARAALRDGNKKLGTWHARLAAHQHSGVNRVGDIRVGRTLTRSEETEMNESYQERFNIALEKFGVADFASLAPEQTKDFLAYVDTMDEAIIHANVKKSAPLSDEEKAQVAKDVAKRKEAKERLLQAAKKELEALPKPHVTRARQKYLDDKAKKEK